MPLGMPVASRRRRREIFAALDRLGLLYIDTRSTLLDLKLAVAIASRERALTGVHGLLRILGAAEDLATVALRRAALVPTAPPGHVAHRDSPRLTGRVPLPWQL